MKRRLNTQIADDGALLLTIPETAQLLRVSSRWVWSRVWAGEIPSVRLGRLVRVPRPWVEHFIQRAVEATKGDTN